MKLPFNVDLKDKVAVVTGGSGILCGAMAEALAACGAKVAILALGQEGCDAKAEQIKAAFEKIISSREYQKNAYETGKKILSLGGIQSIIRCL